MNRNNIILIVIAGLIAILFFVGCGSYNGLVSKDENVKQAFGNVQAAYQRRADLIPGLIRTVQEAAKNERGILEAVTKARAGIVDAKKDIENATTPQQIEAANQKINSALTIAVEAYPQVRSTEAFLSFQGSLTETENIIYTKRGDYNLAVKELNVAVRKFPGNIFAGMFGFKVKDEFKAKEGSENAPNYDNLWDKGKN
ncbi:MAG: LemA family protein [Bacteroidetes bacterium]|nr:LemA family protein [Bacteroidota bacterium]MBS3914291.1 LemA family protein [Bacteroidota bacterium]